MGMHPEVENDNGSLPNAYPPSNTEEDFGDERTAAETYVNNNGNNMIAMAMGLKKENKDAALVNVMNEL
jgi:hypothetical protein